VTVGLKTTSVTDDVTDWPIPEQNYWLRYCQAILLFWRRQKVVLCTKFKIWNYECIYKKLSRPLKKQTTPWLITTALNLKRFEKVAYIKSIHIKGAISSS